MRSRLSRSCSTASNVGHELSRRKSRYSLISASRTELRGSPAEMDHLRGGLGGLAPIHLNVDSRIIHGFRWVDVDDLLVHEEVRPVAASALLSYLETTGDALPASIPAIVACSRTNTIIDGHHRHQVVKEMGFPLAPGTTCSCFNC